MDRCLQGYDPELNLYALSFACRLVLSQIDPEALIVRSLESLADFGRAERAAMFLVDHDDGMIECSGLIQDNRVSHPEARFPIKGHPLHRVIESRQPAVFGLASAYGPPLPTYDSANPNGQCYAAPLIAVDGQVVGLVSLAHPAGFSLSASDQQALIILLTVIAMALETARLFDLAVTDDLTGLYMKRYFQIRLYEEWSRLRRSGGRMAVMVMDLDRFKAINDAHGHQFGDRILKEAARIIGSTMRQGVDLLCRWGGDEFAAILVDADQDSIETIDGRIRDLMAQADLPIDPDGQRVHMTVSAGAAWIQGSAPPRPEELFQRADQALYQAKQAGRNRLAVWDDPDAPALTEPLELWFPDHYPRRNKD